MEMNRTLKSNLPFFLGGENVFLVVPVGYVAKARRVAYCVMVKTSSCNRNPKKDIMEENDNILL